RVIFHFALHLRVHLTAHEHGMRGAGVGSWSHRGDVTRLEKEKSGGGSTAAAGRHVGDYRNRRGNDFLDRLAHSFHQTTGRVEPRQDGLGILLLCLINGAGNNLHRYRVHNPVYVDSYYSRRSRENSRNKEPDNTNQSAHHLYTISIARNGALCGVTGSPLNISI